MPPLGEVVDGALRGDLDDLELTRVFGGLRQRYGPFRLEDANAWYEPVSTRPDGTVRPEGVGFEARIVDDNGADAGIVIYGFGRDSDGELVVTNDLTELNENFRGKGFSTAFSASTEEYFRRSGVDRMLVTASMRDGGVAWAKAGYDWDLEPTRLAKTVERMQSRVDEVLEGEEGFLSAADIAVLRDIRARFDGPVVGFPSPQELVLLAGDDPKLGEKLMRGSYWHGMKKL